MGVRLLCNWRYVHSPTFAIERDLAIDQREEGVVFALADALAWMKFVANLANEDVASDNLFAAKFLHAAVLGIRVATVAARALSFFVGHCSVMG